MRIADLGWRAALAEAALASGLNAPGALTNAGVAEAHGLELHAAL